METPAPVLVHSAALNLKGTSAELIRIAEDGYYELNLSFGENLHRVLLPIAETVIIARDAEISFAADGEIER